MKKALITSYAIVILTFLFSILHFSCQKEDSEVNPSGDLNSNRDLVVKNYNEIYLATEVNDVNWTGNTSNCEAGSIPQSVQDKVLKRINYFRTLTGLNGDITFDATKNAKCQKAALMFLANNQLSHTPPSSWTCYTNEGAEAAKSSNIYLGREGTAAISGYIEDPGANNYFVGHRRWILYSAAKVMGHGSTSNSDALWVTGGSQTPTSLPEFIAWPPQNYIPAKLVFPRWSFAIPSADFTNTQISMTDKNDNSIGLTVVANNKNGYGDNTIVWEPENINTSSSEDITYNVKVKNVKLKDGSTKDYSYKVIIIQP